MTAAAWRGLAAARTSSRCNSARRSATNCSRSCRPSPEMPRATPPRSFLLGDFDDQLHLRMNRAADAVGASLREDDIAALAGRDVAGVGLEVRRIDKGVMHERLVIGEVNDAALADNDARRREQPVR